MSYSNRIWLYGPFGAVVLLGVLYSIYWRVGADILSARLDSANRGEVVPGVVLTFAEKQVGGYPFRFDVLLSGVMLTREASEGNASWHADKLAFHALTYGRPLYVLEAAGEQTIEQPDSGGGPPRRIRFTPGIARASAILRDGRLTQFDLDLWQTEGRDDSDGGDTTRTFSAGRAQFHLLARPDDTIAVAAKVEDARLGEGFGPMLGGPLRLADFKGQLSQAGALAGLSKAQDGLDDAAEAWRASGGRLSVDAFSIDKAGLKTTLSGTLGLDGSLHPEGSLSGAFDPAEALGAMMGGRIILPSMGESTFSLIFKNGGISAALDSGRSGLGR